MAKQSQWIGSVLVAVVVVVYSFSMVAIQVNAASSPAPAPYMRGYEPTLAPDAGGPAMGPIYGAPEYAPSNAPEYSPSNAPDYAPSNAPDYAPSNAPEYSPEGSPVSAPLVGSPAGAPSSDSTPAYAPGPMSGESIFD